MKKGFTLIELLIVLAIIGTLVTMAVVRFAGLAADRDLKVCQANLRTLDSAISVYRIQEDAWPDLIGSIRTVGYVVEVPACPGGGTYALDNSVSGDNDRAECSVTAHSLPKQ